MASRAVLPLCFLTFLLLLASSSSVSACCHHKKVKLNLYYETLCPGCSDFMVNLLPKIFGNGLIDVVHLHLVPFGNAKVGADNKTISCQHGPDECALNMVEACVMNEWPRVRKHYSFLHCVENLVVEGRYHEWNSCFQKTGLDPNPIADCMRNGTGDELVLKYANETNSLVPRHEYVPWVVVDGKPLREKYEDFMIAVCKAYKGNHVPKYCNKSAEINLNASETSSKHVCRVEETTISP